MKTLPEQQPRFALGQVVATPGTLSALLEANQTPFELLARHFTGDWGELDPQDIQANEDALQHGGRLLSRYQTAQGVVIWIITEWDRSATTLLLPSEY
jgi:hypothetical protein